MAYLGVKATISKHTAIYAMTISENGISKIYQTRWWWEIKLYSLHSDQDHAMELITENPQKYYHIT